MLRNVGSNWVLIIVNIAATYLLTPLVIKALGDPGYGTWTLVTAICGYIGLLALGVPTACVRYIAQNIAEHDLEKVNTTIGSCAGLYLAVGGVALIVGGILTTMLSVFHIPPGLEAQTYIAFVLMSIHVSAGFIALLPEGIMVAHHDFVLRNIVRIAAVLLRLLLTFILLYLSASLIVLAVVQLAILAFDFGISWWLIRRRYPGIRINLMDFDWRMVRQIFSFSAYVMLLTAGARLTFETDAIVIGAFLDVGAIPFYVIANSLVVYLMDFVISIAAVVSPMATTLHTQNQMDELRTMFLKWSKVALSLTLLAGVFLLVLGPKFVSWWIDPSYELPSGQVLQILILSSFLFLPVRGVAQPILVGIGKPHIAAVGFVISGVLNVVLSIALVRPFGLVGVAIGTAVPNMLFALVVLIVTCRELKITFWQYTAYVVPRAAVGALAPLVLLLWFKQSLQVDGLIGLAVAGVATVAIFGVTWVFFVYRRDPLVDVSPHLARIRAWGRT